ncbi:hypothetical protein [Aurantimonas sp. VKM B-3413]|uniref:DUF6894 family protein n=1 Tax=Aurantimonas sp. VKM B-3413 TaxID=2779401 RepID=UPI001E372966|nr:hypothetical protein [Aurantimonas sp. VKM B-3413]MCB8835870.1 hypothetical protein [Aurantimonas sp. VKM B-3413]
MPHYFFDIQDDHHCAYDDIGFDCDDVEAVRCHALAALPTLARDAGPDGDRQVISVLVRDAEGGRILKASLTLTVEWDETAGSPPDDPSS